VSIPPPDLSNQTEIQLDGKDRSLEIEMVAIVSNRNTNSNPRYIRGILSEENVDESWNDPGKENKCDEFYDKVVGSISICTLGCQATM
jgi:hypothetical protein